MLGKKVGSNLYIHKEYIGLLLDEYLSFYNDIHLLVNPDQKYNIIKMDIKNQKISFLKYCDFYNSPFPILLERHSYDIATKKSNIKNPAYLVVSKSSLKKPLYIQLHTDLKICTIIPS